MRVLIADDDEDVRHFVESSLGSGGHSCVAFANGRAVVTELARNTYDLLILDWNMPGYTGLEIIDWVQANLDPVPALIVMTSRNDKEDIVRALEAGADDYIVKPETADVILARVSSVLRRSGIGKSADRFEQRGRYQFDKLSSSVEFDGRKAQLTAKEFDLVNLFFDNLQRPLSRDYIMERVWKNVSGLSTRTLDMHVSRLRTKLDLRAESGYSLQTVFGYGYRLDTFEYGKQSEE